MLPFPFHRDLFVDRILLSGEFISAIGQLPFPFHRDLFVDMLKSRNRKQGKAWCCRSLFIGICLLTGQSTKQRFHESGELPFPFHRDLFVDKLFRPPEAGAESRLPFPFHRDLFVDKEINQQIEELRKRSCRSLFIGICLLTSGKA